MNLDKVLFETFMEPTMKLAKPMTKKEMKSSSVKMTPELRRELEMSRR